MTPSPDGDENLLREGVSKEKIIRVGNIMIDSLEMLRSTVEAREIYREYGLEKDAYGVVTLHRPSNVDDPETLAQIIESLLRISEKIPLLFPVHPRTGKNLEQNTLMPMLRHAENIFLVEPLPYIRFMNLVFNCRMVLTDSGGIQEETTYLGIPCLTLRRNTERPVTITQGTNQLCEIGNFEEKALSILFHKHAQPKPIEFWDGKTAQRVVLSISKSFTIPTSVFTKT